MTIWNPGHLPENWTPEKVMQQHSSKPFNPEIANTFFRSGEIEMWGRGIERIVEECRSAGFPDPVIQYDAGDWRTEFAYPKAVLERLGGDRAESGRRKSSEKPSEKRLGKTAKSIVALIRKNPNITTREIAEILGVSRRAIELQIDKLKGLQIVRRVGPDKGGHWEIIE